MEGRPSLREAERSSHHKVKTLLTGSHLNRVSCDLLTWFISVLSERMSYSKLGPLHHHQFSHMIWWHIKFFVHNMGVKSY